MGCLCLESLESRLREEDTFLLDWNWMPGHGSDIVGHAALGSVPRDIFLKLNCTYIIIFPLPFPPPNPFHIHFFSFSNFIASFL